MLNVQQISFLLNIIRVIPRCMALAGPERTQLIYWHAIEVPTAKGGHIRKARTVSIRSPHYWWSTNCGYINALA